MNWLTLAATNLLKRKLRTSQIVAIVAVFAALNVVTDSFSGLPSSGVWYSWNFLIEPLTGIVLGPLLGFSATFTGVMIGHYIYFIDLYEFLFTIGAPIGVSVSALMFKGRWKPVLAYYIALLTTYFVTPIAWELPLWGMWDTYAAFFLLIIAVFLIRKRLTQQCSKSVSFTLAMAAFVGLEADVLFRIVLLVPGQTYRLFYGWDVETLKAIWGSGALITPLKVGLSTIATLVIGHPLVRTLRKASF